MTVKPTIRCAIYTRKSSEEGLEQGFNSLDAQHEACTAYIASQRHEGWKLVPDRFDDGGLSGGTLERAGLQRLLTEIDAGRIGMVVVYKIDRLTRSLADFAKLVERLEKAGCSFVSVTQAFNTSSSMGRLTLNVLLSFAQFEREVTAERIRDKIAASKRKGMWMGGTLPLGYDRHPDPLRRELIVNPREAVTVSRLFALYAEHGNLRTVRLQAALLGLSPRKSDHEGDEGKSPPAPFTNGQLHYLLTNPVYRGLTRHKKLTFPGLHAAIIEAPLWEDVQSKLIAASARRRGEVVGEPGLRSTESGNRSPLVGKLRDETGDRLTPSHTQRHGRRLRYYVSRRLLTATKDPTGWRLPAEALERCIATLIAEHLRALATGHAVLLTPDAAKSSTISAALQALALTVQSKTSTATLRNLLQDARLSQGSITVQINADALAAAIDQPVTALDPDKLAFNAPFNIRRRGVEMKIIAGFPITEPDPTLRRVLAKAHRWVAAIRSGVQITDLARDEGHSESYISSRAMLAFLSPKIQAAILAGTQPLDLTTDRLVKSNLPSDWQEQERLLGFCQSKNRIY